MSKISTYTALTKLPKDTSLLDVSEDNGGGFDTRSLAFSLLKGLNIIATAIGVDTGTEAITAMTDNVAGKRTTPMILEVVNTTSGQGLGGLQIRINKNGGTGDILGIEELDGFSSNGSYVIPIFGATDEMEEGTDTYNLEIVNAAAAVTVCDFILYGGHRDI